MKTTEIGGSDRGYDGGKKVNGRKRHIMVDTLGLMITVIVHAANFADSTSARMVVADAHLNEPTLEQIWADQGYRGDTLQRVADGCSVELEVVERTEPGFAVLPKRWVKVFIYSTPYSLKHYLLFLIIPETAAISCDI